MAATKHKKIVGALAAATGGLLANESSAASNSFKQDWVVDSCYFTYREKDRVEVDSFVAMIQGQVNEDNQIKLDIVLDTMTGSTPTGALPGNRSGAGGTTTVTGTSGETYSVGNGSSGLASFSDTRMAMNLNWTREHSRTFRMAYTGYASVESDYTAFGGSAKASLDSFNRLTTYSLGIGGSIDKISRPSGGTPEPLSALSDNSLLSDGNKNSSEIIAGLSRVINDRMVAQLNFTYAQSTGYHTDPYKLISRTVLSNTGGSPIAAETLYESRPETRNRTAIYTNFVYKSPFTANNIKGSYRYYEDDWGVASHTVEYAYRFNLKGNHYWEPVLRYYNQSKADFYFQSLGPNQNPEYASADNRLANMTSMTYGMKYGMKLKKYGALRLKVQYLDQAFENASFEKNEALIFNIAYLKKF